MKPEKENQKGKETGNGKSEGKGNQRRKIKRESTGRVRRKARRKGNSERKRRWKIEASRRAPAVDRRPAERRRTMPNDSWSVEKRYRLPSAVHRLPAAGCRLAAHHPRTPAPTLALAFAPTPLSTFYPAFLSRPPRPRLGSARSEPRIPGPTRWKLEEPRSNAI